jgi:hypothetical protein
MAVGRNAETGTDDSRREFNHSEHSGCYMYHLLEHKKSCAFSPHSWSFLWRLRWRRVLIQKPITSQRVKKSPAFMEAEI